MKRYISDKRVRIGDSASPKPSTRLDSGDVVHIDIPPPAPILPLPEDLPLEVIHEDDSLLVINKSPDIVVHPSNGTIAGGTLVNALLSHTDTLSKEGGEFRPGIVHRLDRETSGIILVARTDLAHRRLAAQFKEREVHKEYLACVHGVPKEPEGVVDLPIARSLANRKKMAIRHDEQGKQSVTRWKCIRTIGTSFSWIHCFPETGRTHQIRLHMKAIGHPIICDSTYGREKKITRSELLRRAPQGPEDTILDRQALHAYAIEFRHPGSGEMTSFCAPLPDDLQPIWDLSTEV